MVEQAAIAGALDPEIFGDAQERQQARADYIAKRLDALADETERGWQGDVRRRRRASRFERTVRGVKEAAIIDQALLGSADARKLDSYAPRPAGDLSAPAAGMLRRKDEQTPIHGPVGAVRGDHRRPAARASRCSATKGWAR